MCAKISGLLSAPTQLAVASFFSNQGCTTSPFACLHLLHALVLWIFVSAWNSHQRSPWSLQAFTVWSVSPHLKQYCGVGDFWVSFSAAGGEALVSFVAAAATPSVSDAVSLAFLFLLRLFFGGFEESLGGSFVFFVPPSF